MTLALKLEMIIFSLFIIFTTLYIVRKGRISIKYSLVWFLSGFIVFLFAVIPNFLVWISKILGFQTVSNMFFSLLILVLILICLSLTVIVSGQSNKIRLLIQEISMLKEKNDEKTK